MKKHIIMKNIARNMVEKKFRTFLIIFSIMISSALFLLPIPYQILLKLCISKKSNKIMGVQS